jgi:hypothetical protein
MIESCNEYKLLGNDTIEFVMAERYYIKNDKKYYEDEIEDYKKFLEEPNCTINFEKNMGYSIKKIKDKFVLFDKKTLTTHCVNDLKANYDGKVDDFDKRIDFDNRDIMEIDKFNWSTIVELNTEISATGRYRIKHMKNFNDERYYVVNDDDENKIVASGYENLNDVYLSNKLESYKKL